MTDLNEKTSTEESHSFDQDYEDVIVPSLHTLERNLAESRASLRKFKLICTVLFIICLGLVSALGQVVTSARLGCCGNELDSTGSVTAYVNSTDPIFNLVSLYHCDPELEQDQELQGKMDSIVRHIMQTSNDAIVPRFHLKKRDDNNNNNNNNGNNNVPSNQKDDMTNNTQTTSTSVWDSSTYQWTPTSTFVWSGTNTWTTPDTTYSWNPDTTTSTDDGYTTPTTTYAASWSSETSYEWTGSQTPETSTNEDSYTSSSQTEASTTKTTHSSTMTTSSPKPSEFSTTSGSFIVMGYTTVIDNSTVTSMHTIVATPTATSNSNKSSSSGLSTKNKHIVIGCVVGLGVPIIALIAAALFWYKKRNSSPPTGRNYVDSNGRDVGIAVDSDSFMEKLKFWKKNKTVGDFNDDSLDEDFSIDDDARDSNAGTGSSHGTASNEHSFVVDRPKPVRNQPDQNF